jgi:hypothetical protein
VPILFASNLAWECDYAQEKPMVKIRILNVLLVLLLFVPALAVGQYGNGDSGQYSILSAQYGTAARHVDVTNRLRQLAQTDRSFRMGNSTFGVDPAPGQRKVLRIYARGPNGRERMFEYLEGSTVDGNLFRGWGRGDWGQGGWSGRWEQQNEGYERQPNMEAAMQNLREAQRNLESAARDKGGHRERALEYLSRAIEETQAGIQFANQH